MELIGRQARIAASARCGPQLRCDRRRSGLFGAAAAREASRTRAPMPISSCWSLEHRSRLGVHARAEAACRAARGRPGRRLRRRELRRTWSSPLTALRASARASAAPDIGRRAARATRVATPCLALAASARRASGLDSASELVSGEVPSQVRGSLMRHSGRPAVRCWSRQRARRWSRSGDAPGGGFQARRSRQHVLVERRTSALSRLPFGLCALLRADTPPGGGRAARASLPGRSSRCGACPAPPRPRRHGPSRDRLTRLQLRSAAG